MVVYVVVIMVLEKLAGGFLVEYVVVDDTKGCKFVDSYEAGVCRVVVS